ncbi:DNA adenine methylase [Malaciobacter mytili]|uniref:DNA adenine methylase n=1 Tax=Malaciobacter mytili TaxID=603050 RepID=UPI003A86F76C
MNISVDTFSYLDLLQKEFIKSPLNYTGGKFKLLNQIVPFFPKKIDTFVDLFSGGCNVAINSNANKIIANDINKEVIELYEYFKNNSIKKIKTEISNLIKRYNLSESSKFGYEKYNTNSREGLASYNKENYLRLREDYNSNPNPIMFYTLVIFAFNNQIRFNKNGKFNLPVNKRDFTSNMQKNLELFVNRLKNLDIEFKSTDFRKLSIFNDSFVYLDPPYLATTASYNENGGWNEKLEEELLDYLDSLTSRGIKFALSNVLESKGNKNQLLIDWCKSKNYKVNYLNHSYSNCNYQTKNRDKNSTIEVLITNY